MERLRILHITSESSWRGGENQLLLLLRQLRQIGHSAALAAPPGSIITDRFMQDGGKVFSLKQRSDIDLLSAWELSRICHTNECDLIHAHTGRSHAIAACANLFHQNKKPIVVSRRVSFSLKTTPWNKLKYVKAHHYIPISNASREPLLHLGIQEQAITVIPDGVDAKRFELKSETGIREEFEIPDSAFIIGNVAHCEPNKNQALILDAAPEFIQQHPDVRFIIVGDGKELSRLKQKANQLNLNRNVIFPGFRNDVERFYQSFDAYVITSQEEG
ncbi:glycosyltransferase, partial [bacterium]|nr:glycosyltransferase [bacterium]